MNRIARYLEPEYLQFTGREFDPESTLQNYQPRHFDPTSGQWLATDAVANESGDANLRPYVGHRVDGDSAS